MLGLLVMKVGVSPPLSEAAAVKALQANENAFRVILRLSDDINRIEIEICSTDLSIEAERALFSGPDQHRIPS
jgi:hypothetical protein